MGLGLLFHLLHLFHYFCDYFIDKNQSTKLNFKTMLLFQLLSIIHYYTYYGFKLPFICYYIIYADYCNYLHYGTYVNFTYISIRHCLDDKVLRYVILWTLICLLYILYDQAAGILRQHDTLGVLPISDVCFAQKCSHQPLIKVR